MGIDEKFLRLSPAGQDAVKAFIEFLLFREKEQDGRAGEDEYEAEYTLSPPAPDAPVQSVYPDQGSMKSGPSGIILAEERDIGDTDDIIDFADINTRFSQKEDEKIAPAPVRKRKMFDWL